MIESSVSFNTDVNKKMIANISSSFIQSNQTNSAWTTLQP